MPGRLLLDTSAIIDLFRGEAAAGRLLTSAEEVFVSVVAVGELLAGAERSERRDQNVAQVESFASSINVLGCDVETAHHYAAVKHGLRRRGRPLPENDVWIASVAKQHQLTLVTRDAHFREIDGLSVVAV